MPTILEAEAILRQAQAIENTKKIQMDNVQQLFDTALKHFMDAVKVQTDNVFNPSSYANSDAKVQQTKLPLDMLKQNVKYETRHYQQCQLDTKVAQCQLDQAQIAAAAQAELKRLAALTEQHRLATVTEQHRLATVTEQYRLATVAAAQAAPQRLAIENNVQEQDQQQLIAAAESKNICLSRLQAAGFSLKESQRIFSALTLQDENITHFITLFKTLINNYQIKREYLIEQLPSFKNLTNLEDYLKSQPTFQLFQRACSMQYWCNKKFNASQYIQLSNFFHTTTSDAIQFKFDVIKAAVSCEMDRQAIVNHLERDSSCDSLFQMVNIIRTHQSNRSITVASSAQSVIFAATEPLTPSATVNLPQKRFPFVADNLNSQAPKRSRKLSLFEIDPFDTSWQYHRGFDQNMIAFVMKSINEVMPTYAESRHQMIITALDLGLTANDIVCYLQSKWGFKALQTRVNSLKRMHQPLVDLPHGSVSSSTTSIPNHSVSAKPSNQQISDFHFNDPLASPLSQCNDPASSSVALPEFPSLGFMYHASGNPVIPPLYGHESSPLLSPPFFNATNRYDLTSPVPSITQALNACTSPPAVLKPLIFAEPSVTNTPNIRTTR